MTRITVRGFRLLYHGALDAQGEIRLHDWVARLEDDQLRRWSVTIRGSGGVCLDFPAAMDELAVLQAAQARYPGEKVTVELTSHRSGAFAWFRHPDLGGCVDIEYAPSRQQELFA